MPRRKHRTLLAARKAKLALAASLNKASPIEASAGTDAIPSAPAPPPVVIDSCPQMLLTQESLGNCDAQPVRSAGQGPEPEPEPEAAPSPASSSAPTTFPQLDCPKTDYMAFAPFPKAQIILEEACWALDPMTVLLLLAEGRQGLCLGGLYHRDGNSPLQMAVDGLIYQLDHLRHHHPENVGYREACRRNFHTIMTALVEHMTLPELQNWNYYDQTNAVGKLAFHAFDWRPLQILIEAMNRLSGDSSGEPMFRYNPGRSCKGCEAIAMPWENDSHVVGCLCEKFWDPLNQWWALQVHPCGKFVR